MSDANHPMAGKIAKRDAVLADIRKAIEVAAGSTDEDRRVPDLLEAKDWEAAEKAAAASSVPGLAKKIGVYRKTSEQIDAAPAAPAAKETLVLDEDSGAAEHELRQNRIRKMQHFRDRGDEPFKRIFNRSHLIGGVRSAFERLEMEQGAENAPEIEARLAGRITARRIQGKSSFMDIRDETGRIQVFLGEQQIGPELYEVLRDLDIGDFVGVTGSVKRTKRGELTIFAHTYELLTKSLRPSAAKWHGISDVETRYRQRYLDMVANPEVLDTFKKRIRMIAVLREWLTARGFLEVETPMLHPIPGGATARPFITHHNTYDRDFYLRIAPELYLKRLIVGGFDKVFEVNRNFRNEGVDTRHNPEFTMMELYEAYQDYNGLMDETEEMLSHVMEAVVGSKTFSYQGKEIKITRPWKRLRLFESIREYAGIDLEGTRDRDEAARLAASIGVPVEPSMGYGKIVDAVMSEKVQLNLFQPTFLYDYPIELSPLAKRKADNPALTERFQPFIACLEVGNAFSELNDPIDQRERFEAQVALRDAGDDEAQYLDEDFITALEIGMPPTAGLGIGIDRLAMICTDSASIREVIFFPQLRTLL